jgi:histidyl-tRNA synthetase
LALESEHITAEARPLDLFVLVEPDADRAAVLAQIARLRAAGIRCDTDYAGRSLKGQRTQLARSGALGFVHVRADGATIKRGDDERDVAVDEIAATVLG